jgi:predicted TIM-barrel fold metal-dependent hydrolase
MFMDQIYCSYWFEGSTGVDAYLKEFGPDNLMFETDFPHPTGLYPNSAVEAKIKETLGHHDRATQEKVLYKNAERIYGVKVYRPATCEPIS